MLVTAINNNNPAKLLPPAREATPCLCGEGVSKTQYIAAYADAKFWQAQHKRAVQREKSALEQCEELNKTHKEDIQTLKAKHEQELAKLKAALKKREDQLFAKKTEKGTTKNEGQKGDIGNNDQDKRNRGSQFGSKGHGRISNKNLPVVVEYSDLPEDKKQCPHCKLPFQAFAKDDAAKHATEDSEIIECHIKAHIRRIKRKRYKKTCQCPETPNIITAPVAPRLIPKGKLGVSVWVHIILDKYLYYNPTYRLLCSLKNQGLSIAQGTVTEGLQKISPLLEPLYNATCEKSQEFFHHQADETRWQVFEEVEGKMGHRWYLWIFITRQTKVFYVDPTRSSEVPKKYFQGKDEGILSVDRYSAYKAFVKGTQILLAFCWAHVRRDFLDVAKAWGGVVDEWAMLWVEKIGNLYYLNKQRLNYSQDSMEFNEADKKLREAINEMKVNYLTERAELEKIDEESHLAYKKVLISLEKHWPGLILFVDHPEIPMDNNKSENGLRGPVLLRNASKGSGSIWSSKFLAMMCTLLGTLALWNINPHTWFTAFLTDCAANGGQPPAHWESYLPWNMSEAASARFSKPPNWDTS